MCILDKGHIVYTVEPKEREFNYYINFDLYSHLIPSPCFIAAHVPLYLYPFLATVSKTRPFEYLRLTSLGVIGALVKVIYIRFQD